MANCNLTGWLSISQVCLSCSWGIESGPRHITCDVKIASDRKMRETFSKAACWFISRRLRLYVTELNRLGSRPLPARSNLLVHPWNKKLSSCAIETRKLFSSGIIAVVDSRPSTSGLCHEKLGDTHIRHFKKQVIYYATKWLLCSWRETDFPESF